MIELYTAPTPNGHKASCTLEALELEYNTHTVNIGEGDQHKPDFRTINPNGRIRCLGQAAGATARAESSLLAGERHGAHCF
tara:strand:+ start:215 stop:457 length:243 start_codon:yes stop_codon:yes gene_type:complete